MAPCVLNRTSILLSFVRFSSIWDFCHHLTPAEETTRADVLIQPTHKAIAEASPLHDLTTT
ncbi:hypothetical protein AAG906_000784 [Vitis piasezkii]